MNFNIFTNSHPIIWLAALLITISFSAFIIYFKENFELSEVTPSPPWVKFTKKDVLDKNKVSIVQFAADENETIYNLYRFNHQKKIMPLDLFVKHNQEGRVTAFGKEFANYAEFESETNHFVFGLLDEFGYSPKDVPLALCLGNKSNIRKNHKAAFYYPLLFITIQNENTRQVIANKISVNVYAHRSTGTLGGKESAQLSSEATYKVEIGMREGEYVKQMIPPIRIAPKSAVSFKIRILPEDDDNNQAQIADISIHWEGGKVTSSRFLMFW